MKSRFSHHHSFSYQQLASMKLELAGAVSWDLPETLDIVALDFSLVEHGVLSPVLLGKTDDIAVTFTSDVESTDIVIAVTTDTPLRNVHVEVHVLSLSILPEAASPSGSIAFDLEISVAVSWDIPPASKVDTLLLTTVNHTVCSHVLLVEFEMTIIIHPSGNVELANLVSATAPDVAVQIDLEVLEVHVISLAALIVPAAPADVPMLLVVLVSGTPLLPACGIEVSTQRMGLAWSIAAHVLAHSVAHAVHAAHATFDFNFNFIFRLFILNFDLELWFVVIAIATTVVDLNLVGRVIAIIVLDLDLIIGLVNFNLNFVAVVPHRK